MLSPESVEPTVIAAATHIGTDDRPHTDDASTHTRSSNDTPRFAAIPKNQIPTPIAAQSDPRGLARQVPPATGMAPAHENRGIVLLLTVCHTSGTDGTGWHGIIPRGYDDDNTTVDGGLHRLVNHRRELAAEGHRHHFLVVWDLRTKTTTLPTLSRQSPARHTPTRRAPHVCVLGGRWRSTADRGRR